MLENLEININKTLELVPHVKFNAQTGICYLSGDSMIENTEKFYQPVQNRLIRYTQEVKKTLILHIKMQYFNTASSQEIFFLLKTLAKYEKQGGKVEVNWYYIKGDIDMYEEGEDYVKETKLNINFISYPLEEVS